MPQYSKNVAEQFIEPEKLPVGWPWRLFIFSVIVFALILFVYFGIVFGYQPYLEAQRQSLDKKIAEIGGAISETDRENFIKFYSQLVNLQTLLKNHVKGSNIYTFLEKNTNQGIYYEGANLSVPEHFLRLEGIARSYDNLVQQMVVFEQSPVIEKVILGESRTADKGIVFSMQVFFKPELLNF